MKIKVSDYIADFLVQNGISTIFMVVGGGAMHMNDSFGHHPQLHCVYNHHEQASSIAAEAYYRVNNEMAGVCVTSGPGAVNALNGVVGAYQDSIPMIVFSGQTKTTLMTRNSGLPLRTLGNQEYDIIPTLMNATKYAETVFDAKQIRYCLEKAFCIAKSGRPGPCWLEIPVDIQGAYVDADELVGYSSDEMELITDSDKCINEKVKLLLNKIKSAKRPVFYAGNGIRISGGKEKFVDLVEIMGIPVVTCWDSIDLIATDNKYYVGRAGIMGDRPGNFAIQNSDLVIAIGNRLNIYQVGYQLESWAREAYVVDVDIDKVELEKPTIRVDLPICADAKLFLECLLQEYYAQDEKICYSGWVEKCNQWKQKYPVVQEYQLKQKKPVNIYAFIDCLSRKLPDDAFTVATNGSASVVGSAVYFIKEKQRFIMNCGFSSMGYDLPAAIGAAVARKGKDVICLAGDGSIQMNIQELQTITTNRLPIKIVIINNEGYQQIRLTQTNLFKKNFVGIGPESGDLEFPNFEKLSCAYNIPYMKCESADKMSEIIDSFLEIKGFCVLEVVCDTKQAFEPKSATKRLEDGTLISPPLEDLAPFLDRNELRENMIIKMVDE